MSGKNVAGWSDRSTGTGFWAHCGHRLEIGVAGYAAADWCRPGGSGTVGLPRACLGSARFFLVMRGRAVHEQQGSCRRFAALFPAGRDFMAASAGQVHGRQIRRGCSSTLERVFWVGSQFGRGRAERRHGAQLLGSQCWARVWAPNPKGLQQHPGASFWVGCQFGPWRSCAPCRRSAG